LGCFNRHLNLLRMDKALPGTNFPIRGNRAINIFAILLSKEIHCFDHQSSGLP
jgi:hypothetical protein